ncbi:SWIB/MDM2 domain-containing protein [Sphingobium sp.]|uniref:SWIB/MDM2 domain-containing protein n=1 Tax=Sphingobium sp. TaxID=1912891 RepID=UPI0029C092B7|nr:SWIB/MDM2 domain-containing protein [Sphingobium sp.]
MATSKAPAKKAPAKTAAKAPAKSKSGEGSGKKVDGLHRPVQPSPELAAIVGDKPLARAEIVSSIWDYIKKNDLQDPKDRREILADDKLEKVFGKKKASMFEMNKHISNHVKAAD